MQDQGGRPDHKIKKTRVRFNCDECGKPQNVTKSEYLTRYNKSTMKKLFCSPRCASEYRSKLLTK